MHPGKDWIDSNYHPGTHLECIQQRTALTFNYPPTIRDASSKGVDLALLSPSSRLYYSTKMAAEDGKKTLRGCAAVLTRASATPAQLQGGRGAGAGAFPAEYKGCTTSAVAPLRTPESSSSFKTTETLACPSMLIKQSRNTPGTHSGICIAIKVQAQAGETSVPGGYPHLE
jgi:hypothetical protein